jgi:hypothetical protein
MTSKKKFSSLVKRINDSKNKLFVVLLYLGISHLLCNHAYSQDISSQEPVALRPNIFHGGLGFAGIIGTATINYERILSQNFDRKIVATFAKVGYGTYGGWVDSGQYTFVQYGIMTGKNANHLEVSAGPIFNVSGKLGLPIAFVVGYRRQKPGKSFMYRTGLSFPETLHFAMGLSF